MENRAERGQRLKRFAIGQFHNHYQYKSDKDNLTKIRLASTNIKAIQDLYGPRRQYERQEAPDDDDDVSRVRLTLLEYGDPGPTFRSSAERKADRGPGEKDEVRTSLRCEILIYIYVQAFFILQLDLEEYLRSLSLIKDDPTGTQKRIDLDPTARQELQQHYAEFKLEMETDAQELKSQNQQKRLEAAKIAMEHKIRRYCKENEQLQDAENEQKEKTKEVEDQLNTLNTELKAHKDTQDKADPKWVDLNNI